MVIGIDVFRTFFKDFAESYLIIGGTACDIIIEEAGFTPRATDDIDMILIIEALKPAFVKRFWEFIQAGDYATRQIDAEKRNCYRFAGPKDRSFPKQIELFSKEPDTIELDPSAHVTPVPVEEGLSSLSAILLNEDYYRFTLEHSTKKEGLHIASIEAVICLKAFAFLDNRKRKEEGQVVRQGDITKHKYDVFRMVFMLRPDDVFDLPDSIKTSIQQFAEVVKEELPNPDIFRNNGFGAGDMNAVYLQLLKNFNLKA